MSNKILFIFSLFLLLPSMILADPVDFVMVVNLDSNQVISVKGDPAILNLEMNMGSLIKPFIALAANRPEFLINQRVLCPRSSIEIDIGERCWLAKGHGNVGIKEGIAYSCNVYFRHLVRNVPKRAIFDVLLKYDLIAKNKEKEFESFNEEEIIGGSNKIKIRPGKIFGAFNAAFNNGVFGMYKFKNGKVDFVAGSKVSPLENAGIILEGMRMAATEGTFSKAAAPYPQMRIIGKTGTVKTEVKPTRLRGFFIGLVPESKPALGVLAISDRGSGGEFAAPGGIQALLEAFLNRRINR